MIVIDITVTSTCLTLHGPVAPAFVAWVPRQRIVLDPAVIVSYSVTPIQDASTSTVNEKAISVLIDTIERRYEARIAVARQARNTGEWEPMNTSLVARLLAALGSYIDVSHDVRTEPKEEDREGQ